MSIKSALRPLVPAPLLSLYHLCLAYLGALWYGFPSRRLVVIGVTGTNGKSSTTEFINAIFEQAGRKTALSNSIRVKMGAHSHPSSGRSMPGRFFIQRFLYRAKKEGCAVAVIEMTSEGVKQYRHRCIELDAMVFLNLAPEHIESHGSYQAYANAKFELGLALARSSKRPRIMVANADDAEGARYLSLPVEKVVPFSLAEHSKNTFKFENTEIVVRIPGEFNLKNALAAAEVGRAFGTSPEHIKRGIESVQKIPGRMESIDAGQRFSVVIDYALTPDALEALYKTYADRKKICVFGSAGGGRDIWKRPVLGALAEKYCESVILTNDIAYRESAQKILDDIANGMKKKPEMIPDRRLAVRRAFELAEISPEQEKVLVLLTGMGVDTAVTVPNGSVIPWSEEGVAREELARARSGVAGLPADRRV